jgi:DNA primase
LAKKRVREESKGQKQANEVNPPPKFELKNFTPEHPFFHERGILLATVEHFGLGFCSKGMMKDRLAIPIHNEHGQLIAYCGRAVSQDQIDKEGKYEMPPGFV